MGSAVAEGVGAAVAIALLLGCQPSLPPDDEALTAVVVDSVLADAKFEIEQGKTIALDSACFTADLPDLEKQIRTGLIEAGASLVDVSHDCGVLELSGEWKTGPGGIKRSVTHVMPYVTMEGQDSTRNVQWAYLCGPLCGRGGTITVVWDGKRWTRTSAGPLIH